MKVLKKEKQVQENNYGSETWKDIPGYEGIYQASTNGRIRGLDRYVPRQNGKTFCKGRVLKPSLQRGGYRRIVLSKNRKKTSKFVHQLVMETFVGMPVGNEIVIHLEHVKVNENNSLKNLRYASPSCNMAFKFDDGTLTICEKNPNVKLTEKDVHEIKCLLKNGQHNQREIADMYSISSTNVGHIKIGKLWGLVG